MPGSRRDASDVVFDTMVVAYALLGVTEHRDDAARALAAADRVSAPDLLHAELGNVLWQWVKHRRMPAGTAARILDHAAALIPRAIPSRVLAVRALELAAERDHPTYDTVFVALADAEGTRVVTYDQALLRRFPEWAVSVPSFLSE